MANYLKMVDPLRRLPPGNILRTPGGPVVIDWMNVARGDPDGDFARTELTIRIAGPPPGAPIVVRVGARFALTFSSWPTFAPTAAFVR